MRRCIWQVREHWFLPCLWAEAFSFLFGPHRRAIKPGGCWKTHSPLSDVRDPMLTIVCEPCGRRGRDNVQRLMAKHGDAKILYLLAELTSCPKTQSANIYDRCKARYEGLSTR